MPSNNVGYIIVLNSHFIHRGYLEMYYDPLIMPTDAINYADSQDCQDILMRLMVTKFLENTTWPQSGVLAVKHTIPVKHMKCKYHKGCSENDFITLECVTKI